MYFATNKIFFAINELFFSIIIQEENDLAIGIGYRMTLIISRDLDFPFGVEKCEFSP